MTADAANDRWQHHYEPSKEASMIDTYWALDAKLRRDGKPVPSRKIANNTYAQRRSDSVIAIKLHDTDIVTHHEDGKIVLNTGGWLSMTTRARMNDYTPQVIRLYSDKGRWMVTYRSSLKTYSDGQPFAGPDFDNALPYKDGMTFVPTSEGARQYTVEGALNPDEQRKQDAHNKQINKLIDGYLRSVTQTNFRQILGGQAETQPCAMCVQVRDQAIVGERMGDTQHLIEHLMDRAVPLSLWCHVSNRVNPSGFRVNVLALAKSDLRKYLRANLLVGQISTNGGRRRAA